jgi:Tfp pilus assembly ATPase PilU
LATSKVPQEITHIHKSCLVTSKELEVIYSSWEICIC